jgi:Fe-S-cluster formation regulator IscX/YfhJ
MANSKDDFKKMKFGEVKNTTFDIDEFKEALRKAKEKLLEAIDFTHSPEEIEERKRNASDTETQ